MIASWVVRTLVSRWPIPALVVSMLGLVMMFFVLLSAVGTVNSAVAADFRYQCDTAVGPDPATATSTVPTAVLPQARSVDAAAPNSPVATTPTIEGRSSPVSTTNPYARLTAGPQETDISEWQRGCLRAMQSAPLQLPPVSAANTGIAVECARMTALALVDRPVPATAGSRPAGQASVIAAVIRRASVANASGCQSLTASEIADITVTQGDPTSGRIPSPDTCPTVADLVIHLPETIVSQSICGQRVDASAISPGDLVYWAYRGYAPSRVGVYVGSGQLVSSDPGTGQISRAVLPQGPDVRIKRVLRGTS